jgi:2-hydroxycyclohexanecarboxyl-CoA dehydrogenase
MHLGLKGKVAIVTGGASNIGRAITLGFVREGSKVVIGEIDVLQGERVLGEAQSLGCKPILIKTDVTDNRQVEKMIEETLSRFGRIDILVNNVGGAGGLKSFLQIPREEWQKEMDINFWGTVNCIRAVIGHMVQRKYGKIVNISSDAGRMGEYNLEIYSAAKGAVISMSKSLARGFGKYGINVNVVCPGATYPESPDHTGKESLWNKFKLTPEILEKQIKMYPLRKFGKPEDIANAVLFLSSDVAGNITGQTLSVSGGYTMM